MEIPDSRCLIDNFLCKFSVILRILLNNIGLSQHFHVSKGQVAGTWRRTKKQKSRNLSTTIESKHNSDSNSKMEMFLRFTDLGFKQLFKSLL